MGYQKVGDVVAQVRGILQDNSGERWTDTDVYQSLNLGLIEARRVRPDLFIGRLDNTPQYTPAEHDENIAFEQSYIPALTFYTAGMLQAFDVEGVEDARAVAMLQTFTAKLITGSA